MPYFLVALLVVATVFLLLGVIGRGVEAGSGSFMLKVEGKVGPFPRVIFLIFSAVNYAAALVLFLALIGISSSSTSTTPAGNTLTAPEGNVFTTPAVNPQSLPGSSGPAQVTIDISDTLSGNEYSETVTVNIDGASSVTLTADQSDPSPDQNVTLPEGQHAYQISVQGITTDNYNYDYAGQGTIIAEQGNTYGVVLDSTNNVVGLQPG